MTKLALLLAFFAQDAAKQKLRVELAADGKLTIAGKGIDWKDVDAVMKRYADSGMDTMVVQVDPALPFSSVLRVMNAGKAAGLASVEFAQDGDADVALSKDARKSLRIKVKDGPKGLEIVLLQESTAVSMDDLKSQLKRIEKRPVVIDADDTTSYGLVKQIVSACTAAGFDQVSFASAAAKSDPVRVLYAEQNPRWEFRYLRNMLERSADFKLDVYLASADKDYPGSLPAFPADLSPYDVILMGDLDKADPKALADFVKAGGGVVWLGPDDADNWIGNSMADICPVAAVVTTLTEWPGDSLPLVSTQKAHPLVKDQDFAKRSMPFSGWKASPNKDANILVEGKNPVITVAFLVTQSIDKGRAAYVGPETWRWRAGTGDQPHFAPFWSAVLKYAAGK